MKNLIERAKKYQYTSLLYTDLDDIGKISLDNILETEDYIFILKEEENQFHIYWSAQAKKDFFNGLEKSLKLIEQKNINKKRVYIQFIHEDFVENLKELGFEIDAQFCDFWIKNLNDTNVPEPLFKKVRFMKDEEYKETAAVTRSCRGQSRGFNGENDAFTKEWNEDKNSCIIIAESDNNIVGVCYMNIYGFDSEQGPIAWLREIAVHPDYQGKGIGYSLIYSGLNWGKEQGAIRSFLAADLENHNAIRLYEKFGYRKKEDFGEINMAKYF